MAGPWDTSQKGCLRTPNTENANTMLCLNQRTNWPTNLLGK